MSQQRGSANSKKNKPLYQPNNSVSQWQSYSRTKQTQSNLMRKKKTQQDDGQWIGNESTPTRPQPIAYPTNQSYQFKPSMSQTRSYLNQSQSNAQQTKNPTQLIQDILKGLSIGNNSKINPYYSQQSEEKLTQILTNQNKLQAFISELEADMLEADPQVVKNYEMLIILLNHVSKADIEVKHSSKGLQLNFNRNTINKQQNQIEKLEKKIKQKDQHIKQIIQQYQSVIRNFNDVIQKLLEQRITNSRVQHNQQNLHHLQSHHKKAFRNQRNR